MLSVISFIKKPFVRSLEERVKRVLSQRDTYPGFTHYTEPNSDQRSWGVDLILHFSDKRAPVYLQLQPNYAAARLAAKYTTVNCAIIVADNDTPKGLLIKKLREGIDYFKY